MKFELKTEAFNAWDTLVKFLGLIALLISGAFAWHQYTEIKEQEYKKAFYEKQISVIEQLFEALHSMDVASTNEERDKAIARFFMIYQGSGRTFLSPGLYAVLNAEPLEYVQVCVRKVRQPKLIQDCSGWTASKAIAGFALVARSEFANTWKTGFSEISSQDPWNAEAGGRR